VEAPMSASPCIKGENPPRAVVLTGTGINCDLETASALQRSGARVEIVHVSDLLAAPERLLQTQLIVFPGGFSYGDDTGAGNALAARLRHRLSGPLQAAIARGALILGICNGFQILVALGILPGGASPRNDPRTAALLPNEPLGFQCRWVNLVAPESRSHVLNGLGNLRLPIAHGEGRFFAPAPLLAQLRENKQIALRYEGGAPNGSLDAIAAVCDPTGQVLGLMPHPERAFDFHQRDDWPRLVARARAEGREHELPPLADGARIFAAAVRCFS